MTEREAKTKWCPMARVIDVGKSYNRNTYGEMLGSTLCFGSDCVMWRWIVNPKIAEKRGYCGLGGKP
jgi:hypothetical protein